MAEKNNLNDKFVDKSVDNTSSTSSNDYNNSHQIKRKKHTNHSESSDIIGDEQFSSYDPSYCSDSCDENNSINEKNKSVDSQSNMKNLNNKIQIITNDKNNDSVKDKLNHHKFEQHKQIKNGKNKKEKILINNDDDSDNVNGIDEATGGFENSNNNNVTQFICRCSNKEDCLTLEDILKSFNAPLSEEQAWALIYQSVKLYRDAYRIEGFQIRSLKIPKGLENLNVHKDGSIHVTCNNKGK